ncbi:hypothetical protein D3C72_1685600 [compost metagenome]
MPECFQITRAIILVVGVVRVLPDVAAQQRRAVAGQRRTRIAGGLQAELTTRVLHQPHPAGAEQAKCGSVELFAKTLAVAELALDQLAQAALRFATATRAQALPVEAVVPGLGGGIEQRALGVADDVLQRGFLPLGADDGGIDRVDIGAMVAAVVQFHGLCREVRLQGRGQIGQGGQFDGHGQVRGQGAAAAGTIGLQWGLPWAV